MNRALAIILGGGRGTRLFPLTLMRSKPAVPIAGKYRLIDLSISNCLHAELRRMFVLTQFNSASLNRHVAETYRLDMFSRGFVEVLAAEQTPDSSNWFQGTADAVRQAVRHFARHDADYYLILAGDHVYRMDYRRLLDEHVDKGSDVTIAAQPVTAADASEMGIFTFDRTGQITGFEEKPTAARLEQIGSSVPPGSLFLAHTPDRPFVASMGIYLFTRDVLLDLLETESGVDFGREIIPAALRTRAVGVHLFRGYWADVGTVESFYRTNIMLTRPGAPFNFYDPRRPIYTRARFLPPSRLNDCHIDEAIIAEGSYVDRSFIQHSVVGIRTHVYRGCRITRSVLLGADYYEGDADAPVDSSEVPLGIGRETVLDRVIVDKNARIGEGVSLTNAAGIQHADGNGYYIRNGIIIVPRGAVIASGTVV